MGKLNEQIGQLLPCSVCTTDQRHWDTHIRKVERHLNTVINKTTSKTPYEVLHGYIPRIQQGVLRSVSRTRNNSQDPKEIQLEVRQNILDQQKNMKKAYDKRHYEGVKYQVGEVVVMLKQPTAGEAVKLQSNTEENLCKFLRYYKGTHTGCQN